MNYDRKLILEDGSVFTGCGFGSRKDSVFEVVFNTSMAGYQEILSDPSYTDQGIVFSYPLIGNYGITDEDFESKCISPSAVIVRDLNDSPSNFRATGTVEELLADNGIPGLGGVDTRRLVRSIRDLGSRRALLTDAGTPVEEGLRIIRETPVPHDSVRRRSCVKKWYSRTSNPQFQVVVIDCGMKTNIVRMLNRNRCNVTVVPFDTSAEEILSLAPDGVMISNGPGDPEDVPETIRTLQALRGHVPLFGICLGHQLIALSCGARTYKLKFGHRGGNHPVKDLRTGRIEITSQNHSYAVVPESLAGTGLEITHHNVLDDTVEGLQSADGLTFSVQYHPESAPGPQDSMGLFAEFTERMRRFKAST
ncbi:MAG: glutamine-hydrolyzing carbamoyl-phosphate synthase small subunit [Bacteroidaceae bacterium]|nr:glutamine-hydrolyzing carbamoyl-phosphate synthase small subunit [Bacteroidaceae bacterium]